MPDAPEVQSLNAAAASAAAANDVHAAAALLRQVLDAQRASLGRDHPDLATTLNNLALMLERSGEVAEAGRCYERAHAIAAAGLPPDDPIVRVSQENLAAYYQAYGRTGSATPDAAIAASTESPGLDDFAPAPPSPAPSAEVPPARPSRPAPPPATPPDTPQLSRTVERPPRPSAPLVESAAMPRGPRQTPASRPPWVRPALIAVTGLLLFALAAIWRAASDAPASPGGVSVEATVEPSAPEATVAPPATPAPAVEPEQAAAEPERAPAAESDRAVAEPEPAPAAEPVRTPAERPGSPAPRDANDQGAPGVVEANVCRTLSRAGGVWSCEPIDNPTAVGAVSYYTRIRSARDIVVGHRWSHDGRVVRVSRLRIGANPSAGYRTFTRQALRPGEWAVALIGPDDRVLHEQRFVVR